MQILGTVSSSIQKASTAFESIASATGTGSSNIITFSSIPSTYKSLQLRVFGSSTAAGTDFRNTNIRFNSDSGSNYAKHSLTTEGSAAYALGGGSQTEINTNFGYIPGSSLTASGAAIIDIIDYANTNKNTTVKMLAGGDGNGSGNFNLASGAWFNTSAINSITLTLQTGNYSVDSTLALYGIKG